MFFFLIVTLYNILTHYFTCIIYCKMILNFTLIYSAVICDRCFPTWRIFCYIINTDLQHGFMGTHSLAMEHAHIQRVMPRNNPLCRLIDQITSRWNTLPNSNHHTHRLPFRNEAFLFVQFHPRRSFHLASPRRTSLPPRHPSRGHWGGKVARAPFFISPTSRNSSMRNH